MAKFVDFRLYEIERSSSDTHWGNSDSSGSLSICSDFILISALAREQGENIQAATFCVRPQYKGTQVVTE